MFIKCVLCLRLSTEQRGLIKSHSCSACLASEQTPPPFLLVGFLQQTDNRNPTGLPVHLTGHDCSHTEPCPPAPSLIYFGCHPPPPFIFLLTQFFVCHPHCPPGCLQSPLQEPSILGVWWISSYIWWSAAVFEWSSVISSGFILKYS